MKVLLIDNYDSFIYNIVHAIKDLGLSNLSVLRNTDLALTDVSDYDAVIAGPGPGLPADSGLLYTCLKQCLEQNIPYLGVCLGHQALAEICGEKLYQLDQVSHGVEEACAKTADSDLLRGLDAKFNIGRYHSWAVAEPDSSSSLEILARTADGVIQAIKLKHRAAWGVQFHPESIMTAKAGPIILRNFIDLAKLAHA